MALRFPDSSFLVAMLRVAFSGTEDILYNAFATVNHSTIGLDIGFV